MAGEHRTETRTITLTTQGTRFREGPIDARGWDVSAVHARLTGTTAWSTGVVELKSSLSGLGQSTYRSFSSAQNLTSAAPILRAVGETDPAGVRTAGWLDGFVTTAESGVELEVQVHLRKTN